MAVADSIILDPAEVADSRTELAINSGAIRVGSPGPDWGEAQIQAFMAETSRGSVPVDYRVPNREVKIPLIVGASGKAAYTAAKSQLQAKVGRIQDEGGWLKRTYEDGRKFYLDIVNATLTAPDEHSHLGLDAEDVLTLECLPDFYGDEIALPDHTETAAPCLVFTDPAIRGDYPARARLVIDDDQARDQMFVMWGVQSRRYDPANTAKLFYEAESLTPLGGAAVAAGISGSSGAEPNVVRQSTLTPSSQAMLSTQASGGGAHMSHVGTFRIWARTHRPVSNTGKVSLALEWAQGDFTNRTTNDPVTFEANDREGANCLVDLGTVSIAKAAKGTQRWEGRVIAKSTVTGDDLDIDCLFLMPVDEGYGEARGSFGLDTPTSFTARDEFDQTAGALAGKNAPVGGAWSGAGDADDFTVDAGVHRLWRSANGDAANTGCWAIIGSNATGQGIKVTTGVGLTTTGLHAVCARYVDTSNFLRLGIRATYTAALPWRTTWYVEMRVAGTFTTLASGVGPNLPSFAAFEDFAVTLTLLVFPNGVVMAYITPPRTEEPALAWVGHDPVLATGGALASGKATIYDQETFVGSVITRQYDDFAVWVPTADAAMFASQSLEIHYDRAIRKDATGAVWSPIPLVGDYLRLPPAGLENRTTRMIVKASRNDPDTMSDPAIDDISARVYYRPCWLQAPST